MEALYKRVLARVPTPQLHENYNAVLEEELQPVARTLDDVTSAFAKLEEVHDAVSKLQQSQDSSTGGRSDSLMASADNAMELQRQLLRLVEKLAVGMEVAQVERKRKRVEEEEETTVPSVVIPVPNGGGEDNGRASCKGTSSNTKRIKAAVGSGSKGAIAASGSESSSSSESDGDDNSRSSSESDSDDVEGSEAAWRALTTKGKLSTSSSNTSAAPTSAKTATKPTESNTGAAVPRKSATYLKTIVELVNKDIRPINMSFIIPDVVTALKESVKEDVDAKQPAHVACSLEILVGWWVRQGEYQAQYAGLYREYAAVVESYADRLPSSACKSNLKRLTRLLKEAISSTSESLGGPQMPSSTKAKVDAAVTRAKQNGAISSMAGGPDILPHDDQIRRLLFLLVAFKKETTGNVEDTCGDRIVKALTKMSRWIAEGRRKPTHLAMYRLIVNAMQEFSKRILKLSARDHIVGVLENMSEVISDPSNAKNLDQLANIRRRAEKFFGEVKRWQQKRTPISTKEAHTLKETLFILVKDTTVGWNPCQSVIMRRCVKELKSVMVEAQALSDTKSARSFDACLNNIARWGIDEL